MSEEIRFCTVEAHLNPWDAHICRALLESEGIPATVAAAHHVGAQWPMAMALGGVRVQVPAKCLSAAQTLLAERDRGMLLSALESDWPPEVATCPQCAGTQFRRQRNWSGSLGSLVMLYWFGAPFPPIKQCQCKQCGHVMPC